VVLKLFAPLEAVLDRTNPVGESHFGEERVARRSRIDHGGGFPTSTQVIRRFDGYENFSASALHREPSHEYFVTQHTVWKDAICADGCETLDAAHKSPGASPTGQ
jgi:hypothetical protein